MRGAGGGADLTSQLSFQLWGDNRTVSLSGTAEGASKGAEDAGRLLVSFCVIWHTFHMEGRQLVDLGFIFLSYYLFFYYF